MYLNSSILCLYSGSMQLLTNVHQIVDLVSVSNFAFQQMALSTVIVNQGILFLATTALVRFAVEIS